jgi:outer membrane protein assembly factor BamA
LKIRYTACFILLFSSVLFFTSCSVTKKLPPNEYLLIKNKFKVSAKKIDTDELSGFLQQTPNSKLFGLFRTNIALYNMGNKGKDSKFKKWLREKAGSAPVLLDTAISAITIKQMGLYLNNVGYFNSIIHDSIIYKRKKATVYYVINTSTPYTIRNIFYSISDRQLAGFINKDTSGCLIKRGENYNSYTLDKERTRIMTNLLNHGYYQFSTGFVIYHVDSILNSHQMDIDLEITNPVIPSVENFGTFVESVHRRYKINNIYIFPDYDPLQSDTVKFDTLVKSYLESNRDSTMYSYYFLYSDKLKVKPRTLVQSVFIKPGSFYSADIVNKTYLNLGRLPIFRYKNIQFVETTDPSIENKDLVNCRILLAREQVQSISFSPVGTNSAGAFGVQGNVIYQNRNIFRGAQLFSINLSAALQAQGTTGTGGGESFFNTIELGANTSLTFPQFLFPVRQETIPKRFKPKTSITIGYNFQRQSDYQRHISNITFGYSWNQTEQLTHTINPAEISFVKVYPDSAFNAWLYSLTDTRLINQYTDHAVAGLRYTITYNSQDRSKVKDFFYIRSNFQTGGNLFYIANSLLGGSKNGSSYTFFGVPYSQFVRPDLDFRFYEMLTNNKLLVYRFYGGIGVPYGNSSSLPFEKAFFAGGANDIRGWRMGSLGPGSYFNDTVSNTYNQIGDMQLQANFEYRFPVYKMIKGAVFLDAGNIWLLRSSADFPGGKFNFDTFIPQIALDAGFGIRLDFDFFVFRLDPAIPIRVPHYPAGDRWYFDKIQFGDVIWNFGIGYPF